MGPPPTFPPQSTSLPPTFFMPPPGPVHISVSSVGPNFGSNLNFIRTPNVTSSPDFHISQQGSSSALPTSSTPAASPASSTPSISRSNIGVSGTPTSPSIGSATSAASRGRSGKVTPQFDTYGSLIIVPDEKDGFFPSFAAAHMVIESMKPLYDDAWGRWKDIPYDIRDKMWNQFRTLCVWEQRYDNEIKYVYEKKAKKLIPSSLYEARDKNKKPGWIREDVWIKFLAIWDSVEFKEKSERAKAARASQKGGSLHTGGSMSFAAHRQRLHAFLGIIIATADEYLNLK
ncbi:PREDICTED: uncharacterized protein LOC109236373 [Nicotiana attenuata]|uniref:uncharacterized protein LOC109236373 n=1 Tax=Nicotiana attenuata TaxID=49451 RepID=UPI000905D3EF|nr:PREDICTED: uncharacterized protein LOC109236373 [Nicotiana attenuata]